jgi:hypothetical protein
MQFDGGKEDDLHTVCSTHARTHARTYACADEQKDHWTSEGFIQICCTGPHFLSYIIAADECLQLQWDHETEHQNME